MLWVGYIVIIMHFYIDILYSRSKSPGGLLSTARRNRGLCTDPNDQAKNIKISKDRKVQSDMAKFIFDFMEQHDCPAKPGSWKELMNPTPIPTPKFWAMVKVDIIGVMKLFIELQSMEEKLTCYLLTYFYLFNCFSLSHPVLLVRTISSRGKTTWKNCWKFQSC